MPPNNYTNNYTNNLTTEEAQHIERLHAGLSVGDTSLEDWILRNIRLKGKSFSFKEHEYQQAILADKHNKIVVKKCSQIGASELNISRALAFVNLYPGVKLSYVLPSAKFAQKFVKMRFDPVIAASPNLKSRLERGSDSSELKQFGDSFLMSQGASASSKTNVLAIDLDALVVDELDGAEDVDVINQLISRLTHSNHKNEFYLSTPTVPGYGISDRYDRSKRHVLFQKCSRCNHWFQPDYYEHVFLPGFHTKRKHASKTLRDISFLTSSLIEDCNVQDAVIICPNRKCKKPLTQANLADPTTREFVCENKSSNAEFHGYHIPPFAVPTIITPGDLISRSARYSRVQDFTNDALGLELSSKETGLDVEEINSFFKTSPAFPSPSLPPYTVMGLDMGGECSCTIGYPGNDTLHVVHAEKIPLHNVRKRVDELYRKYKCVGGVVDSMPYTDSVLMLQEKHTNMYASIFSNKKGLALYDVREQGEGDDAKAMSMVRAISVARDRGFDLLVASLREERIQFDPLPMERTEITEHMMDLKRIHMSSKRGSTADEDGKFVWRKTRGIDHYFFSLLYLFLASCMCSAKGSSSATLHGIPLISKFKNKNL